MVIFIWFLSLVSNILRIPRGWLSCCNRRNGRTLLLTALQIWWTGWRYWAVGTNWLLVYVVHLLCYWLGGFKVFNQIPWYQRLVWREVWAGVFESQFLFLGRCNVWWDRWELRACGLKPHLFCLIRRYPRYIWVECWTCIFKSWMFLHLRIRSTWCYIIRWVGRCYCILSWFYRLRCIFKVHSLSNLGVEMYRTHRIWSDRWSVINSWDSIRLL